MILHRPFVLPVIALVSLAACTATPPATATPGAMPPDTPAPSATPEASPTATPAPTSTRLPRPTPTATATPEPDYLSAMDGDAEGNLWLGGFGGVLKFDPATEAATVYSLDEYSREFQVFSLLVSQEGKVWAAGRKYSQSGAEVWELFRLEDEIWHKQEDVGGDDNTMRVVAEGEKGDLWVRRYPDPMLHYDGRVWRSEGIPPLGAFARASDGTWWGTNTCCEMTSFTQFDGKAWSHYQPETLFDPFVPQIATAPDGSLWFRGCYHLFHYDTDLVWTPYTATVASDRNSIRTLTVATDGAVWIGTDEGNVQRFQNEIWYDVAQYPDRAIMKVESAPDGAVWAATEDDCVLQFDQNGATGKSYRVRHLNIFADPDCLQ
ncbi:MAG: hypothetical protein JXA21_15930 [Anaerolineae bacterium]|nr:hypothetical protein [Anaerolineae bacterium]